MTGRTRVYVLLGMTLVAGHFAVRGVEWRGSTNLHTLMEVAGTLLALVAGVVALLRYNANKHGMLLFLGTGFVGAGVLDGYHAVVTSEWFAGVWPSPPRSLAPWSWNASRLFLSLLLFMSWWAWRREQHPAEYEPISDRAVYLTVGIGAVASVLLFALAPLPRAYYPGLPFGRPQEFLAAAFFGAALIGFLTAGGWHRSPVDHWLVVGLIISVMSQAAYMPFSFSLFDGMFDAAHLLKNASYVCVSIGFAASTAQLFRDVERSASQLSHLNRQLREEVEQRRHAQEELRTLADELEDRVADRTSELQRQQLAALNLAQDAETARRELARYSSELARSNADLQQFAYVASHDLQEPLRMVASYTQLLARRYGDRLDEDAREFIGFAVDGATRMQSLINDLLTYSRVETKGKPLQPTDTRQALAAALADLQFAVGESGAVVSQQGLPTVMGDPAQLHQLFLNFVGNAIKFRRAGTPVEIHVAAHRNGAGWKFAVRDNGIGLDQDEAHRIFTIFQRLHPRSEYPGTGIGLAICKRIVERHGGHVWVESTPGLGSTFYFTIPDPAVRIPGRYPNHG